MSAALSPSNSFSARLTLAAGVLVMIEAPSLAALGETVSKLEAANDPAALGKPPTPTAATAQAGKPASATAASSARVAAAPAAQGDTGNGASTSAQGTAQPAASGSAAGEAGNATGGPAAAASPASSPKGSDAPSFDTLKKAFLALSQKADGRAKCEALLAPFNLKKLSDALPAEHHGKPADQVKDVVSDAFTPIMAAIEEASK